MYELDKLEFMQKKTDKRVRELIKLYDRLKSATDRLESRIDGMYDVLNPLGRINKDFAVNIPARWTFYNGGYKCTKCDFYTIEPPIYSDGNYWQYCPCCGSEMRRTLK